MSKVFDEQFADEEGQGGWVEGLKGKLHCWNARCINQLNRSQARRQDVGGGWRWVRLGKCISVSGEEAQRRIIT